MLIESHRLVLIVAVLGVSRVKDVCAHSQHFALDETAV